MSHVAVTDSKSASMTRYVIYSII